MEKIDLKEIENKKIAFVLSGGVVKAGAWHLGVALALEELGFTFKNNNSVSSVKSKLEIGTYVGSSAGALIGVYLASGFSPDEIIQANFNGNSRKSRLRGLTYKDMLSLKAPMKKPPRSKIYRPFEGFPLILKQFLKPIANFSGFFTTSGISKYLKNHILSVKNFKDFVPDLFIVATQLDHSRKVIFGKYNYPSPAHDSTATYYTGIQVHDAAAASMSIPPFYSPYPVKNPQTNQVDYYIDGEIRETLSTHVAIDNHCECIISSWTHTPYHYQDEIGSLINYGLPAICVQAIYLLIQKKIVATRMQRLASKDLIKTVNDYMLSENISSSHRKNILGILERKLNYNSRVRLIDIYPKHEDYKLFFSSFFSLNPELTSEAVKMGYKRTLEIFKRSEWEN